MKKTELSASTVLVVVAIVGAAAFAAGRSSTGPSSATVTADTVASPTPRSAPPLPAEATEPSAQALPPGHPPTTGPGAMPGTAGTGAATESALAWKTPARWQTAPNASAMRLATYRIPRAPGDAEDAEMSVMQAGGTVDANVERWIGQFDEGARKTAKRTTKKVGALEVTIVEIEGTYAGGMAPMAGGAPQGEKKDHALLAAIAQTEDMPHFFKMTGPAKTVKAARAELDALVASFTTR